MNTLVFAGVTFIYFLSFVVLLIGVISDWESWARHCRKAVMAGFALHTAGLALRWIESNLAGMGHAPMSNFYESLVFFSWAVVLLYLMHTRRDSNGIIGLFLLPAAFLFLAYASFSPSVSSGIQPLVPALKSNWLIIHVVTCFLGYASFFIASSLGLISLLKKNYADRDQSLGIMMERTLKAGFILFTFGIITGSAWAYFAWGMYWSWDPKETWAITTWFIYAAAIHVRIHDGSMSRRAALITVIGLMSVIFTYFGVNYLPSLHSYR